MNKQVINHPNQQHQHNQQPTNQPLIRLTHQPTRTEAAEQRFKEFDRTQNPHCHTPDRPTNQWNKKTTKQTNQPINLCPSINQPSDPHPRAKQPNPPSRQPINLLIERKNNKSPYNNRATNQPRTTEQTTHQSQPRATNQLLVITYWPARAAGR